MFLEFVVSGFCEFRVLDLPSERILDPISPRHRQLCGSRKISENGINHETPESKP